MHKAEEITASVKPIRAYEYFVAIVVAILILGVLDIFTNTMSPKWDPVVYTDMARSGILGNDHLVAPYAYRPGMPFLAGVVARTFSLSIDQGFLWVMRFAVVLFLFSVFLLARCFTGSLWKALLPVLFAGISAVHVKISLFVPTAVDVAAFPLMVFSVWAFVKRRLWLCLCISGFGLLFFKEFLAIPLLLLVWEFAKIHRRDPNPGNLRALRISIAVALVAALALRLGLHIVSTDQEIDPLHRPRSLARLILNPLKVFRDINIVYSILGYWLPCILLATRARLRNAYERLKPLEGYIAGFILLNMFLVMYGGTNVLVFVCYSVPILVMVLACFFEQGVPPVEWLLVFAFVAIYNHALSNIPLPENGFDAFDDFYGGWHTRVSLATWLRILQMLVYFLAMRLVRRRLMPWVTARAGKPSGSGGAVS